MRIYVPEEERDSPVVICSELLTNEGCSVTYAAEQLVAEVIRYHRLPAPVVWGWAEAGLHRPDSSTSPGRVQSGVSSPTRVF